MGNALRDRLALVQAEERGDLQRLAVVLGLEIFARINTIPTWTIQFSASTPAPTRGPSVPVPVPAR
jgi:hypothetical protein